MDNNTILAIVDDLKKEIGHIRKDVEAITGRTTGPGTGNASCPIVKEFPLYKNVFDYKEKFVDNILRNHEQLANKTASQYGKMHGELEKLVEQTTRLAAKTAELNTSVRSLADTVRRQGGSNSNSHVYYVLLVANLLMSCLLFLRMMG